MNQQPTISVLENGNLHIHIPMKFRRIQGRKKIIMPAGLDGDIPDAPSTIQSAMAQALVRAFSWTEIIESGQVGSITELARRLDVDTSYVTRTVKLTNLAPDIVEAILNGEEPNGLSLARLSKPFPEEWEEQRQLFGFKDH